MKMKKEEFLRELERHLSGISEEERADAMAFYRSYLEDAGEENEEAVIAELESPQKVAESILKDLGIEPKSEMNNDSKYYNSFANRDAEYYNNVNQTVNNLNGNPKKNSGDTTILIIVIAILTSPIWGTALIAVVSVVFGLAIAAIAMVAALLGVGIVLGCVGIGTAFGGSAAAGIGLIGGGCIVLALGILALLLVAWAIRGICYLCKLLYNKGKERMAS